MHTTPARQLKKLGLDNIIIAANRAPFTYREEPDGLKVTRSAGGLVTALEPVIKELGGVWIGWCGRNSDSSYANIPRKVDWQDSKYLVQEIFLSKDDYQDYYYGFSNDCLWPISHCFLELCKFSNDYWQAYKRVNRIFAEAAASASTENSLVWFQDYHLALAPAFFRNIKNTGKIAFFWHIPFPPPEIIQPLPWVQEIMEGLLGNDLLAFHLDEYAENFMRTAEKLLDLEVDCEQGIIYHKNRPVRIAGVPIGIDFQSFNELAADPEVQKTARSIRETVSSQKIILSIERLDYTKGIFERLRGTERFLEMFPEYRDEVTFVQITVPSRTELSSYAETRQKIEETVGRINGRFGTDWQPPVYYMFTSLDRKNLVAHYLAADIALVTPLRDGLNLIAKEYTASRINNDGVLVVSPFAGAAKQLKDALITNPYHEEDMAYKIKKALDMPLYEQQKRMKSMREIVRRYDINWWLNQTITELARHTRIQHEFEQENLNLKYQG